MISLFCWALLVFSTLELTRYHLEPWDKARGVIPVAWPKYAEETAAALVFSVTWCELWLGSVSPNSWAFAIGCPLSLAGGGLRRRAKRGLGRWWSMDIELRPDHQLIEMGLYAFMRHPLSLGVTMELVGLALAVSAPWGFFAAVTVFVPTMWLRVRLEDRELERFFGERFRAYRDSHPGFLPLRTARKLERTFVLRCVVMMVAPTLAITGTFFFVSDNWPTYVVAYVLITFFHFFWVDVPPPAAVVLPYLCTVTAFCYIAGPAVMTLDFLAWVVAHPIMLMLYRRGLFKPTSYLRTLLDPALQHRNIPAEVYVDPFANRSVASAGLAGRWAGFGAMQLWFPHANAAQWVAGGELAGFAVTTALTFFLPLPVSELLKATAATNPDRTVDFRVDISLFVVILFLPLLFLIYYGYERHGLVGAGIWSLATLGPHYVLKVLNDRRLQLEEKAHALEEKQEELKLLVYSITHDLKNPIGAIRALADIVREREGDALSVEGRSDIERIVRLAGGTEEMVRDLVGLFEIASAPEQHKWVDLNVLVQRSLDTLGPQIKRKGIQVRVVELPRVWGQEAKLGHAVENLISNAVKYVPAERGEIDLGCQIRAETLVFWVRDNGIGIAENHHAAIFELFGRAPREEQEVDGVPVSGTGVGLAIVKRIVEGHSGRVWVESHPGAGSRFLIELPAAA